MLNDTLHDIHSSLRKELYHYNSGFHKNVYPIEAIVEVQDIVNRIEKIYKRLDDYHLRDYKGPWRFDQDDHL